MAADLVKFGDANVHRSVEETLFNGPLGQHFMYSVELSNTTTSDDEGLDPTAVLSIRVYEADDAVTHKIAFRVRYDGIDPLIQLLRRVADRARVERVIPQNSAA